MARACCTVGECAWAAATAQLWLRKLRFLLMSHSQAQFSNALALLYKVKGSSHDPTGAVTSVLPPTETAGAENSLEI